MQYGDDIKNGIVKVAELLRRALLHPAKNDAKQTRAKEITIEEIKNILAPSIHKKNLNIMEELKNRMTNKISTNALHAHINYVNWKKNYGNKW